MTDDGAGETKEIPVELVQERVDIHPFLSWLDVEVEEAELERVVLSVPYREEIGNPEGNGTVHGGVVATLIDQASGFALRTTFEDPVDPNVTTTDLSVSYVRPARSDLRAEAEAVRAGGSMGVAEVEVTGVAPGGERKVVAVGSATYRLFRGA